MKAVQKMWKKHKGIKELSLEGRTRKILFKISVFISNKLK